MLRIEQRGACAVWTIDRPGVKNAVDLATLKALEDAAVTVRADRAVRAIVLTGAGDAFVSGGDLRELREKTSAEDAEGFAAAGARVCEALEALPVPVFAALPGAALGGGAELALACDARVADPTARISFKQVRMGVTTAWGSIGRLVALVGTGAAARLLYTAQEIAAPDALAMGLVDAVSPPGECVALALAWGADVALGLPRAVAEMKALVRAARPNVAALERARFVETWTGEDHAEAMAAYFGRRPVVWEA